MKENKLVEGYKNRVQSFIYKMISDPYKINYNDEFQKKFSFRPEQNHKENFKLKPFETDKSRVEKYLKNHQEDHKKYDLEKLKKNTKENKEKNNYLQPIMKFKARTDLERIVDTVNSNYFGKIDRNIIKNQLRSLGLITVKDNRISDAEEYSLLKEKLKVTPQTLTYLIKEKQKLEKGPKNQETRNLIRNMTNIIHINKQILKKGQQVWGFGRNNKSKSFNKRKNLNNCLAKNILSEYQKKTHFKAIVSFSLDLDSYSINNDNSDSDNNYSKNKKNCFSNDDKCNFKTLSIFNNSKKIRNMKEYPNINNKNNKNEIKLYNEANSVDYKKDNDFNNACLKTFHKKKLYSEEKMEYLRGLFMKNNFKNSDLNMHRKTHEEEEETKKKIQRMNNVIINGKSYNKFDIAKISNAVLKQCNYIKKNFNKENAGDGKTMITRGMSVNEFTKKYNLPK